jgi:DNA-binding response OmpR family regulator
MESRRAFIKNTEVNLTAKEFDLLALFMNNPGKVYSRESLRDIVWEHANHCDVRTVDVHIRRLREKIEEDPSDPKYILTKWSVGYFFQS